MHSLPTSTAVLGVSLSLSQSSSSLINRTDKVFTCVFTDGSFFFCRERFAILSAFLFLLKYFFHRGNKIKNLSVLSDPTVVLYPTIVVPLRRRIRKLIRLAYSTQAYSAEPQRDMRFIHLLKRSTLGELENFILYILDVLLTERMYRSYLE